MIYIGNEHHLLECEQHMKMADIRDNLMNDMGRSFSVAFFAQGVRYMPDDMTVAEAFANSTARILELHAFRKSTYSLRIFGFEEKNVEFKVADQLTPSVVRYEIAKVLDIFIDDFRLICDNVEIKQDVPFKEQDIVEGAEIVVDLRVIIKVNFPDNEDTMTVECFSSECVGDLRQKMNLNEDDYSLVTTSPTCCVLENTLLVCSIASSIMELQVPFKLTVEKKVMLAFEPINLDNLRQKLPVSLSSTPTDLYNMVKERFQLTTGHRLAINGQALDNNKPLRNQLLDVDDVIQVDIIRPCKVLDLWEDPNNDDALESVYLYSTESSSNLFVRDQISGQRLFHKDVNLAMFGSVVDVFGPISGQSKHTILVDRDVERSLPMLTFDKVVRKLCWARNLLLDVVPASGNLFPKEVMLNGQLLPANYMLNKLGLKENSLLIIAPQKVFINFERKMFMYRFSRGSTFGDVRARMRKWNCNPLIGLKPGNWQLTDDSMHREIDLEGLLLTISNRFKTKVSVAMNNQWFSCLFESQKTTFSEIMISVGKQAKVIQRHLFKESLFCCGCGRQLSMTEEPYQAIPADCCKVKSLRLTNRRVRGE